MHTIDLSTSEERAARETAGATSAFDVHYRAVHSSVLVWTAQKPLEHSGVRDWSGEALVVASRLYFPVSIQTAALFAIFVFLDRNFPYLSDGGTPWLTWSHVLLAFAFLLAQLTNRRYGPGYAFAQILLSLVICDVAIAFRPLALVQLLPADALPNAREVLAFIGAFLVAGYLSVAAFDAARGPRWWTAPLIASYVSSIGFVLLYYPVAYAGTDVAWFAHMTTHAGILIAASVVGLFPYWLLRPLIKPLPGFGGY